MSIDITVVRIRVCDVWGDLSTYVHVLLITEDEFIVCVERWALDLFALHFLKGMISPDSLPTQSISARSILGDAHGFTFPVLESGLILNWAHAVLLQSLCFAGPSTTWCGSVVILVPIWEVWLFLLCLLLQSSHVVIRVALVRTILSI